MTAYLGRFLILFALFAATAGTVVGFSRAGIAQGGRLMRLLAYLFGAALCLANTLMIVALLRRDFSVSYVAQVGALSVPNWVAVASLWSSLEGSILFWGGILGLFVVLATAQMRALRAPLAAVAIATWLACGVFFCFLIAGPSQPFLTLAHPPADGPGPNPLLQNHILMAAHPPLLYLGFVGMTIPFGLAIAALYKSDLGDDVVRRIRFWLMLPWIALTIAIMLGGWWAYEVLGWGGYWAWDPVENASLIPWLTATAALHTLLLAERKDRLKSLSVILVLATFLLTILGTFMTRSGVISSVHAFTRSAIGPILLAFFAFMTLASLLLLAARIDRLARASQALANRRELLIVALAFTLIVFALTVLLGTVFPLFSEALRGVRMSIGRPYFDRMTIPLGLLLLILMGLCPLLAWDARPPRELRRTWLAGSIIAGGHVAALWVAGVRNGSVLLAVLLAFLAAISSLRALWATLLGDAQRLSLAAALRRGLGAERRACGAHVVHLGTILLFASIAISTALAVSSEFTLKTGQTETVGHYTFKYLGPQEKTEAHRVASIAPLEIVAGGHGRLAPRLNQYQSQQEPIATPAVLRFWREDIYAALMAVDGDTATYRVFVTPAISWIWISVGIMALGGALALSSRRAAADNARAR
ncbi:MAG: cytochrome c biogenesis protein CcsA [Vicinamibacteria bacterium]|jgi:cytochrome c-type biogenesis protein CcmF|nr:cytochrome c biogenesis protein CcsA [Vicinamibacteria bacterium]